MFLDTITHGVPRFYQNKKRTFFLLDIWVVRLLLCSGVKEARETQASGQSSRAGILRLVLCVDVTQETYARAGCSPGAPANLTKESKCLPSDPLRTVPEPWDEFMMKLNPSALPLLKQNFCRIATTCEKY